MKTANPTLRLLSLATRPQHRQQPAIMVQYTDEDKGEPIRVADGKYAGRNGWRWKGKKDTNKMTHVILMLDNNEVNGVRIMKDYVEPPFQSPENYVDAAIQQHLEVEVAFIKLCKLLARCHLEKDDGEDLSRVFVERMNKACEHQISQGQSAKWYPVDFRRDPKMSE